MNLGVEPPTKFQTGRLDKTSTFKGGCWERGAWQERWGGVLRRVGWYPDAYYVLLLLNHRECICCSLRICCSECFWHCCVKTRKTSFNGRFCLIITSRKPFLSFVDKFNSFFRKLFPKLNFIFETLSQAKFYYFGDEKVSLYFFVIFSQMDSPWIPVVSPLYLLFLYHVYPDPFVYLRLKELFPFNYFLFSISVSIQVKKNLAAEYRFHLILSFILLKIYCHYYFRLKTFF